MTEEPIKNGEKLGRDEKGRFVDGHKDLGGGRPKGRFSIKKRIIEQLEAHPEQLQEIVDYLIKNEQALVFQMIDGKPRQDISSDNEEIVRIISIDS